MAAHRIIVIEDQEDLAALYDASLTRAGYQVTNAYTGEEGVAEFQANGADAVVLDMTLPEMHGLQTLQAIRAISPQVPVIVVTGETSDETRKQCERLGVHDYLSKPAKYDELKATLRRSLSDPKTTTEEYEVVTMRLPSRIIKCLSGVDANLERAVTLICEEKFQS
ncbi:MAG TPA: response regulator [Pyrinomonadaceae bacterium]|jgi:DNA-binding response OmpR family regulator|nr:response regulator [Pyrinomonadaceae bacterium]